MKTHQLSVLPVTTSLLTLLLSPSAYAQDDKLTASELDDIEQDGFDSAASQNWAQAIVKWNDVLEQDSSRTYLLYFKAQALLRSGDREGARRQALRAREAVPPLKENLAKKNEELLISISQLDTREAEQKRAQMELRAEQKQIAADVRPRASGWIWVGTGAIALGGLSLGGAVWQSNQLVDVREEMKVPQTRTEYDALRETADGHQTLGQVFFFSSVALAATGVGIIIWDLMTPENEPMEESAPTQTSIGVTPTGAFVRVSW
jgi:hypothetical protein